MLCICYSACTKENRSLEGTILHIQATKAWQISMFRDLALMMGEALMTDYHLLQLSSLWRCVLKTLEKSLKVPSWGASCGHYTPTWTHTSPSQVEFLLFHWVCQRYSLWKIYEGIILNITYICVVKGTTSFLKVKRLWTKLITYQWIFRDGSEWKPFVMENPFLIEFMHLLSCWGLRIILLSNQTPFLEPLLVAVQTHRFLRQTESLWSHWFVQKHTL